VLCLIAIHVGQIDFVSIVNQVLLHSANVAKKTIKPGFFAVTKMQNAQEKIKTGSNVLKIKNSTAMSE